MLFSDCFARSTCCSPETAQAFMQAKSWEGSQTMCTNVNVDNIGFGCWYFLVVAIPSWLDPNMP